MRPETEERFWYARMIGWSLLGSGLVLQFLVLPLSGGTRAFGGIIAAALVCCVTGTAAMVVSERLKRA